MQGNWSLMSLMILYGWSKNNYSVTWWTRHFTRIFVHCRTCFIKNCFCLVCSREILDSMCSTYSVWKLSAIMDNLYVSFCGQREWTCEMLSIYRHPQSHYVRVLWSWVNAIWCHGEASISVFTSTQSASFLFFSVIRNQLQSWMMNLMFSVVLFAFNYKVNKHCL